MMNSSELRSYSTNLKRRIARQRAFHQSKAPGDLLVYITRQPGCPSLEEFLCTRLYQGDLHAESGSAAVQSAVETYLVLLRQSYPQFYAVDDDSVPCAIVYWGIGGITAAMVGRDPIHDPITSWLEPNLPWTEIERLAFDPANRWLGFARQVNRALWRGWQEDFLVLPYLHRSPLDAANGIRGTELFSEMYEAPERVLALIDWCADWSIAVEEFLKAEAPRPAGWGVGVWETWLPDDAVFVNGDPVGVINRKHARTFDQPSIEKLFTHTGGGFFHNHTVGLYQVDLVSTYQGMLVQFFVNDPRQPALETALLDMPELSEKIVSASRQCPVGGWVSAERLDELLAVVRRGRFILSVTPSGEMTAEAILRKVRAVGNRLID